MGVPGLSRSEDDKEGSESDGEDGEEPSEDPMERKEKREGKIDVREYGTCPICEKKWQNPAVLPTGWVVCWRCGWEAVEGETDDDEDIVDGDVQGGNIMSEGRRSTRRRGKCPITGAEVGEGQLRRVLV